MGNGTFTVDSRIDFLCYRSVDSAASVGTILSLVPLPMCLRELLENGWSAKL